MQLDPGSRLLSDLVFVRTYAEKLASGKKERVEQTINRSRDMHTAKFPLLTEEIKQAFESVHNRLVVPSMRSMQFAGYAISRSNVRIYNCAYTPIESFKDFADATFISMNGAGVGFSVQSRHISQLPAIAIDDNVLPFLIDDSKEAWAESILMLMQNPRQEFRYDNIRAKGAPLSTGGTASGPESLQLLHEIIRHTLLPALGRQLRPIEVHDIMCHIGDLVFCGGVRRTALISLFDVTDEDMLRSKHGSWWEKNPQRARANNSAVIHRGHDLVEQQMRYVLQMCFDSNAGEPGIFLTNDYELGANPCVEISLRPRQFCNLTEINLSACQSPEEFLEAAKAGAIIGTLQASYTDFAYIDSRWKKNCEEEALLGVSITGQAESKEWFTDELLREGAKLMVSTNQEWAGKLGINPAARIGCTKPSGSTSAWLGTTSGVHAAHDDFYLRRVRVDQEANAPIVKYLTDTFGISEPMTEGVVERDTYSKDVVVVTVPISKKGAIKRQEESSISLMTRAKSVYDNWIVPSHNGGANYHNVSLTVNYREHEKSDIVTWILANRGSFTGISLLPFDGSAYTQMPFESITEDKYHEWAARYPGDIDLFSLDYSQSVDARKGEAACSAGGCELY